MRDMDWTKIILAIIPVVVSAAGGAIMNAQEPKKIQKYVETRESLNTDNKEDKISFDNLTALIEGETERLQARPIVRYPGIWGTLGLALSICFIVYGSMFWSDASKGHTFSVVMFVLSGLFAVVSLVLLFHHSKSNKRPDVTELDIPWSVACKFPIWKKHAVAIIKRD